MAKKNLEELEKLEQAQTQSEAQPVEDPITTESSNKPNVLDGFIVMERSDLPQEGILYPESWNFAYRPPKAKEVANFSTINEQDQPAIINAIEDLIRKCYVIYDTEKDQQVSPGNINDAHRTFFLLKLREVYLPGSPIEYRSMCSLCKESYNAQLTASSLYYDELSEKLVDAFDGRTFVLDMGLEEPVSFLIPTIDISSKIFKHIVKVYRSNQNDREKKEDKIVYDKQFLLIAPYLFEKGTESIKDIVNKYRQIRKDEELFKKYLDISTKLKLDNDDHINCTCTECGSQEETQIRFPGGWKNMFISKTDSSGYFD